MAFANESGLDRLVRLIAGLAMLGIGWWGAGDDLAYVACRILGWYPLLTSLAGWSPLYAVLGFNTRRSHR